MRPSKYFPWDDSEEEAKSERLQRHIEAEREIERREKGLHPDDGLKDEEDDNER